MLAKNVWHPISEWPKLFDEGDDADDPIHVMFVEDDDPCYSGDTAVAIVRNSDDDEGWHKDDHLQVRVSQFRVEPLWAEKYSVLGELGHLEDGIIKMIPACRSAIGRRADRDNRDPICTWDPDGGYVVRLGDVFVSAAAHFLILDLPPIPHAPK